MNKRSSVLLALLIVVIVGVALAVGLSGNRSAANGCKPGVGTAYTAVIQGSKVISADRVKGKLCDTLTIVNKDNEAREIAFGNHEAHVPYDGIAERVLSKGQSLTITFNKAGSFHWHDHLHDEVEGFFTVSN